MIVQIVMLKNELILLEQLLPIWKEYADGFVFYDDGSTDGSYEYLEKNKKKFNILKILKKPITDTPHYETDARQLLFDTALKYSNNIICLDADEYLDGEMSKQELESVLNNNPDTRFHLHWKQYTSCNTVRIDGPWKHNLKDRIGNYSEPCKFIEMYKHSHHLPIPKNEKALKGLPAFPEDKLFVAHLQWLDKKYVAIKQYYWKAEDWVINHLKLNRGDKIVPASSYDSVINNWEWEETYYPYRLKIRADIFEKYKPSSNWRVEYIQKWTKKYNIPNLGDYGYDILNLKDTEEDNKPLKYKITAIVTVGDLEYYDNHIDRCFKNILEQDMFLQTEHIVVYLKWSDKFKKYQKYPNFKFIKETGTGGVYNAWNIGIKNSTTEYVTTFNMGCLRHPLNTKIKYDLLVNNPEYSMAYNYYLATDDFDEDFTNLKTTPRDYLKFPDNYHELSTKACLAGPDPVWKKSIHDTVGFFDCNMPQIGDWDMWIRFAKNGFKFKLIPEILCLYHSHSGSNTTRAVNTESYQKQNKYLVDKHLDYFNANYEKNQQYQVIKEIINNE